jgi:hypothetical protein
LQRDDLVVLRLRTKKGEYIMTPGVPPLLFCSFRIPSDYFAIEHDLSLSSCKFLNDTLPLLLYRPLERVGLSSLVCASDDGFSMVVMQDPNYIEPVVVAPVAGAPGSEAK